jgi:hypothetical protein
MPSIISTKVALILIIAAGCIGGGAGAAINHAMTVTCTSGAVAPAATGGTQSIQPSNLPNTSNKRY